MIILGDMHPSFYISGFIFDDVVGKTGILRFRLYIATQWLPFLHKKTKLEAAASSRADQLVICLQVRQYPSIWKYL